MLNIVTVALEEHASLRYRQKVIQEALLVSGIECRISPHFLMEATTCFYSKHWLYTDWSDAVGAKGFGKKIVFDVCDDHSETKHAEHYKRMILLADVLTCNSEEMAKRILKNYKKKAEVIPDPCILPPQDKVPDLSKWLWLGHHTNIDQLEQTLPLIEGKALEVCTLPPRPVEREGETTVSAWNPVEQVNAYARNGVAFIPYGDGKQRAKSANRIIEALNASLVPVVLNPIPAAKDLLPFIETTINVSEKSIKKMEQGREYVRKHYSTQAIGKMWVRVLQ